MNKNQLKKNKLPMTYKDAGVDISKGEQLITQIAPLAKATVIKGANSELGGFGGLFDLKKAGFKDPILVSSTDGVGTKLQLAVQTKSYLNIGIDLVAMCANDVLAQGAIPLFFMDYFATGKLDNKIAFEVIKGIAEGCKQSGCALIGGETAEMPGHYPLGSFDLAGFCVGAVERDEMLDPKSVKIGDKVIAVTSSGLHANGYSLVRKIIDTHSINIFDKAPFDNLKNYADIIMEPTSIYTNAYLAANQNSKVKSISHITGGGLVENPPRAFNKDLTLQLNMQSYELPPVFLWLKRLANLSDLELARTFNCGIGLLIFSDADDADQIILDINASGYKSFLIGTMDNKKDSQSVIFNGWGL